MKISTIERHDDGGRDFAFPRSTFLIPIFILHPSSFILSSFILHPSSFILSFIILSPSPLP